MKKISICLLFCLGCGIKESKNDDAQRINKPDAVYKSLIQSDKMVFEETDRLYEMNKSFLLLGYDTNLRDTFFIFHSLQSHVLTELDKVQKLGDKNENLNIILDTIKDYVENHPYVSATGLKISKGFSDEVLSEKKYQYAAFRFETNIFFMKLFLRINDKMLIMMAHRCPPPPLK